MKNIIIEPTDFTPEVDFDFQNNVFSISGESYPEDADKFYHHLLSALEKHFKTQKKANITFHFKWLYFNSSTIKILHNLFSLLVMVSDNNKIEINWHYHIEDDMIKEMGEDLGHKFKSVNNISFILKYFT